MTPMKLNVRACRGTKEVLSDSTVYAPDGEVVTVDTLEGPVSACTYVGRRKKPGLLGKLGQTEEDVNLRVKLPGETEFRQREGSLAKEEAIFGSVTVYVRVEHTDVISQ